MWPELLILRNNYFLTFVIVCLFVFALFCLWYPLGKSQIIWRIAICERPLWWVTQPSSAVGLKLWESLAFPRRLVIKIKKGIPDQSTEPARAGWLIGVFVLRNTNTKIEKKYKDKKEIQRQKRNTKTKKKYKDRKEIKRQKRDTKTKKKYKDRKEIQRQKRNKDGFHFNQVIQQFGILTIQMRQCWTPNFYNQFIQIVKHRAQKGGSIA